MTSIINRILNHLHKIHLLDEWIKNSTLNTLLLSYSEYIDKQIKKSYSKPPLIIFDIDDTLLDTSKISKNFPLFDPFNPTLTFYQYVKESGYHTVILTARNESMKDITIRNLNKFKILDYDEIIFRTHKDIKDSFGKYKMKQRKRLSEKYTIIANVGDNLTDFQGGFNGKIIKIPNF